MKLVSVNVDEMKVFVITNKDVIMINANASAKNQLTEKGICDKGFIWNFSNCNCECDKSCWWISRL